jgi:formamidopyrimidine-DNA glycosylase
MADLVKQIDKVLGKGGAKKKAAAPKRKAKRSKFRIRKERCRACGTMVRGDLMDVTTDGTFICNACADTGSW